MKKTSLAIALSLLTVQAIHADSAMPLTTLNGFELGALLSSYKYKEVVNNNEFMSLQGRKLGLSANYTQTLDGGGFASISLDYMTGALDYTGSGYKGDNPDYYTELRILGGKDFPASGYVLSPYVGLGTRTLKNDLRGRTSTNAVGYRRDSEYLYIPLGVTHRFAVSGGRIATTLEYDHFLQGQQTSYLSDVNPANSTDLVNQQSSGKGMRLGVAYETAKFSVGMFYKYWDIADSDIRTFRLNGTLRSGYEPANTTKELGVQVKARF
nr:hypothetical protein [uncultured Rhodoferax sp.]